MKKLIQLLILAFVSHISMAQTVDYKIKYNTSSCKYEAYAVSNSSFGTTLSGSALFTVVVPGGMTNGALSSVSTVTPASGTWSLINEANTSGADYYAVALSAFGTYSSLSSGDSMLLFTFSLNNTVCASNVRPWVSSDPSDPESAGDDYTNAFTMSFANRYNGNKPSDATLTNPSITSLVPNCSSTAAGINMTASAAGIAASCGSLTYSWTGPNSFTASTEDISVPVNASSVGTYDVTVSDNFGCEATSSLLLDSNNCFVGPVPVTLLAFDGVRVNNVNKLYWSTATEINNSHFEIERKMEDGEFEYIGRVNSLAPGGNSDSKLFYSFDDPTVQQSNVTVYYRLEQVDFDNTTEYHGPVVIEIDAPSTVTMFPNPANSVVNISGLERQHDYELQVFDMVGKLVITSNLEVPSINVSHLAKGVYTFMVTNESGIQDVQKIIIEK
jgi:hypothetical protein